MFRNEYLIKNGYAINIVALITRYLARNKSAHFSTVICYLLSSIGDRAKNATTVHNHDLRIPDSAASTYTVAWRPFYGFLPLYDLFNVYLRSGGFLMNSPRDVNERIRWKYWVVAYEIADFRNRKIIRNSVSKRGYRQILFVTLRRYKFAPLMTWISHFNDNKLDR